MSILKITLELIGIGWLALVTLISIFGGSVKIIIKNPFTKRDDKITDIVINRLRK